MKRSLYFVLTFTLLAVFAVGCSATEDLMAETATDAPVITAEPAAEEIIDDDAAAADEGLIEESGIIEEDAAEDGTIEDNTEEKVEETEN